jgi:peptidoglycan/LPS O-acetylase OafA/YrhL
MGEGESLFTKLAIVSVFPYLYCFLTGALMYLYWDEIKKYIERRALYWVILFILFCYLTGMYPSYFPRDLQILSNFLLSILTLSFAYSLPSLGKLLKGADISYGMYIYHMLIINSFISLGYVGKPEYLYLTILITTLLSGLSWFLVERKVLSLKRTKSDFV